MFTIGENNTIQYLFKDHTTTLKGKYSICTNPLCACCNIDFIFRQNDQLFAPEVCVSLNVRQKEISKDDTKTHDGHLSRKLVDDLTHDDWQFLIELYVEKKTAFTEQADLMSLDIPFPLDEIEKKSLLVSFNGVLPFAPIITLDINGSLLKIEDLYCVRQHCTCRDVHLIISPSDKDNILLPFEAENAEEMSIIYNHHKNKWTLDQNALQVNPNEIIYNLAKRVDIRNFFSERHKLIRTLYHNFRRRYFSPIAEVKNVAIGRNDPCPCGSGKKYKKCCWGKDKNAKNKRVASETTSRTT